MDSASDSIDIAAVKNYLLDLQGRICAVLEAEDGTTQFGTDTWIREAGGGGRTRILSGGTVIEKGGVGFSHVSGEQLPPSASVHRPELAGRKWQALGVSLVIHPRNPYVPTSHANMRLFVAANPEKPGEAPVWWFGGGFDLTPYYGFDEDCVHWHHTARDACAPFGSELHPRLKAWCDDYFVLKHRHEQRGIGGIFFDDYSVGGFGQAFAFLRSVGEGWMAAYMPIVTKRKNMSFGEREREFQLYRRGRYVEFNLLYDRGTIFGLQSGGRTESILMSLPPLVRWDYDWHPQPDTPEAALYDRYLKPRDWTTL